MEIDHPFYALGEALSEADTDGKKKMPPALARVKAALEKYVAEHHAQHAHEEDEEHEHGEDEGDDCCNCMNEDFVGVEGTALFSGICTMNHSCDPNCTVLYTKDGAAHVFAVQDIAVRSPSSSRFLLLVSLVLTKVFAGACRRVTSFASRTLTWIKRSTSGTSAYSECCRRCQSVCLCCVRLVLTVRQCVCACVCVCVSASGAGSTSSCAIARAARRSARRSRRSPAPPPPCSLHVHLFISPRRAKDATATATATAPHPPGSPGLVSVRKASPPARASPPAPCQLE
jgi:hypothetical protein